MEVYTYTAKQMSKIMTELEACISLIMTDLEPHLKSGEFQKSINETIELLDNAVDELKVGKKEFNRVDGGGVSCIKKNRKAIIQKISIIEN